MLTEAAAAPPPRRRPEERGRAPPWGGRGPAHPGWPGAARAR